MSAANKANKTQSKTVASTSATTSEAAKNRATWIKRVYSAFHVIFSVGDVGILIFEFLFINTMFQAMLNYLFFQHPYALAPSLLDPSRLATAQQICFTEKDSAQQLLQLPLAQLVPYLMSQIACVARRDVFSIVISLLFVVSWGVCLVSYFLWRHQIPHFWRNMFQKWKQPLSGTTKLALLFIFTGLFWLQYSTNDFVWDVSNFQFFQTPTSQHDASSTVASTEEEILQQHSPTEHSMFQIDYIKLFQLFIGSPIIEEIILRVVLFEIVKRRTSNIWQSAVAASFAFASLHFLSVFQAASVSFVYFQVFVAFLFGMFYSQRYYLTGNIMEPILLHICNNLTSMFLPITITWSDLIPKFVVPLVLTYAVYISLVVVDFKRILQKAQ